MVDNVIKSHEDLDICVFLRCESWDCLSSLKRLDLFILFCNAALYFQDLIRVGGFRVFGQRLRVMSKSHVMSR